MLDRSENYTEERPRFMIFLEKMPSTAFGVISLLVLFAGFANACSIPTELNALRTELIHEINNRRQAHGLSKLAAHSQLRGAAQGHACWVSDNTPSNLHRGRGRSRPAGRVRAQGYKFRYVNENVAGGRPGNPKEIVSRWMASPGHRRNILAKRPKHIGVGIAEAGIWRYWVMVGGAN